MEKYPIISTTLSPITTTPNTIPHLHYPITTTLLPLSHLHYTTTTTPLTLPHHCYPTPRTPPPLPHNHSTESPTLVWSQRETLQVSSSIPSHKNVSSIYISPEHFLQKSSSSFRLSWSDPGPLLRQDISRLLLEVGSGVEEFLSSLVLRAVNGSSVFFSSDQFSLSVVLQGLVCV